MGRVFATSRQEGMLRSGGVLGIHTRDSTSSANHTGADLMEESRYNLRKIFSTESCLSVELYDGTPWTV